MKRLMAMLATLALVAAAFVSCDKDDPKPQPLDPSYLEDKNFQYYEEDGRESWSFRIWGEENNEFRAQMYRQRDEDGPNYFEYDDRYEGFYTIQGNRLTAKIRKAVKIKRIGKSGGGEAETFTYEAGNEPTLIVGVIDPHKETITVQLWGRTIVLPRLED